MLLPLELWLSLSAIAVAATSILLFIRATGGLRKAEKAEERPPPPSIPVVEVKTETRLPRGDVERARRELRMLSLKREILSMVIKRLFEAEDEGEISREERIKLSKGYEEELKRVNEEIKRAELIVTLHHLEALREDIKRRFDELLSQTQARIDTILRELKLERVEEIPKKPPVRRVKRKPKEEKPPEEKPPEVGVEERLEELRREVLKELEELERLELE
jgi:hypothetical protein